jgi:predicted nucleic acid-binding protein
VITIDTNVLICLWDGADPGKQAVAQSVVAKLSPAGAPLALQVIGETQNVLRRKLKQPPWAAAQNARNLLVAFNIFVANEANAAEALSLMAAGRVSYWDGLLLTAARDAGCTTLLTEDLQEGFRLGTLQVASPFKDGGPSPALQALLN